MRASGAPSSARNTWIAWWLRRGAEHADVRGPRVVADVAAADLDRRDARNTILPRGEVRDRAGERSAPRRDEPRRFFAGLDIEHDDAIALAVPLDQHTACSPSIVRRHQSGRDGARLPRPHRLWSAFREERGIGHARRSPLGRHGEQRAHALRRTGARPWQATDRQEPDPRCRESHHAHASSPAAQQRQFEHVEGGRLPLHRHARRDDHVVDPVAVDVRRARERVPEPRRMRLGLETGDLLAGHAAQHLDPAPELGLERVRGLGHRDVTLAVTVPITDPARCARESRSAHDTFDVGLGNDDVLRERGADREQERGEHRNTVAADALRDDSARDRVTRR
jgi:hypothetical protein